MPLFARRNGREDSLGPAVRAHPTSSPTDKPILFVDVDGVISIFGMPASASVEPDSIHWVDGVAHCIPHTAGPLLERLAASFELVWATGWEQRANEHLPAILNLSERQLPCLSFGGRAVFGSSWWKIDALQEYAGDRPAAWIDDNIGDDGQLWAMGRSAPTLLVQTEPAEGLSEDHVRGLIDWAQQLDSPLAARSRRAA